jgi:hypothetical protein
MLKVRFSVLALAGVVLQLAAVLPAATLHENFSTDPALRGWSVFGDTNLFAWDRTNQNLRVTWDSSQTNSYFYLPLGTVLSRNDDFSVEFDLRLSDIAPTTKPGPFEIGVGFFNLADATRTNFWRGAGRDLEHGPRSIVEFDYFPAGYFPEWNWYTDPTISPTVVSMDNTNFDSGFALLELATDAAYHVVLSYSGLSQSLHTEVWRDGAQIGPIADVALDTGFTDFRLDTFSISSYSDTGDDYDSVLAHGVVDNLVVTASPRPVGYLTGGWSNGVWQVQFASRTNWLYTLECAGNFQQWTNVLPNVPGTGERLCLQDTNPPASKAFYRVRATQP